MMIRLNSLGRRMYRIEEDVEGVENLDEENH